MRRHLLQFVVAAAMCYSVEQLQEAERRGACHAYCQTKGSDVGIIMKDGSCYCADKQPWKRIYEKKMMLPKRVKRQRDDSKD